MHHFIPDPDILNRIRQLTVFQNLFQKTQQLAYNLDKIAKIPVPMLPFHLSQFKFFSRSYCLKERRDTGTGNFCRVPIFFLFMSAIIFVVSDLEKLLPNRLDSPVCQKACYKYRYLFDFDVQATKMLSLYNAAGKLVREGSPGTAILQYNLCPLLVSSQTQCSGSTLQNSVTWDQGN